MGRQDATVTVHKGQFCILYLSRLGVSSQLMYRLHSVKHATCGTRVSV